jgi:replication initiator protein RepSA
VPCPLGGAPIRWGDQLDLAPIRAGLGEGSAGQVAGYLAKYATAMMPMVAAVGSDPVRHRRDAWLWTCRPATTATVLVRRAVVARV